jgi:hypothetical protein
MDPLVTGERVDFGTIEGVQVAVKGDYECINPACPGRTGAGLGSESST